MKQTRTDRGKRPRNGRGKTISHAAKTGDQGIAFIHGVVSRCGLIWVENKGAADVGIDGQIELSDPTSGKAFNRRIFVQSKAGQSRFKNETADSFEFICEEVDLDYWMSGEGPVVLVVSRNGTEGYWKSIKDYFAETSKRASRRIVFDKTIDRFDESAQSKLLSLKHLGAGAYLSPIPKRETLFSNLLPVELGFNKLFVARTEVTSQVDFDRRVGGDFVANGWALHNGVVASCFDLSLPAFHDNIDQGTVEEWSVLEATKNLELYPRITQLLNRLLRNYLDTFDVSCIPKSGPLYYFRATYWKRRVAERTLKYRSYNQFTSRVVVQSYSDNPRFPCWKHSAAEISFRTLDSKWHAVIVPTYLFTTDGHTFHEARSERLKKIKSKEKNLAVRGQVRMWADLLHFNQSAFDETAPLINFGNQICTTLPVGVTDEDWLPPPDENLLEHDEDEEVHLGGLFA